MSEQVAASVVSPDAAVDAVARSRGTHADAMLRRLEDALASDPHSFGFFQAVRLLEKLRPERGQVGQFDVDPAREVVRFGVNSSLGFPASEIQRLDMAADPGQPSMQVNFFGLTGPQGVLPHQYSLLVSERQRQRDGALGDFLDLFNHRLLSLFYQGWRKYRFNIAREEGGKDVLAEHLRDLIGLGLNATRERLPLPDEALVHRAGLLGPAGRGAIALEQLLEDVFAVPVQVVQFVGGWYRLEDADLCVVGEDSGERTKLGFNTVVGDEIWDQQGRVRIRLGPLDRQQYEAFLPGTPGHQVIASVVRFFSQDQFDLELQLVLRQEEVPAVQLGDAGEGLQLGWSTWICSTPRDRDADETILTLTSRAAS